MSYLHSHNVIHRNLAPWNVFLDDHFHPKLFCLDQSIEMSKNDEIFVEMNPKRFTRYLSPETHLNAEYSKSSDVYSFALTVYMIMINCQIFSDLDSTDFFEKIGKKGIRPILDEQAPKCYRLLIGKCWAQNPNERPTFEEIFSNFDGFNKEKFQEYIKFIDEAPKSFQTGYKFEEIEELVKKKSHLFNKKEFIEERLKYSNTEIYINLENYEINKYGYFVDKATNTSFNKFSLKKTSNYLRNEIASFAKEINILTQLDHPSIIKFAGYSDINFENEPKGLILTNCRMSRNGKYKLFSDNVLITIYGIASGMAYLHSHNILHRDLKPENIECNNFGIPTIIGFHIAKEIKEEKTIPNKKIKGTPAYIAPEVYLHQGYSKASDVYSFSLIIYELLTGERPYCEYNNANEIKEFICELQERPKFQHPIPKIYQELIELCWSQDPKSRQSFEYIVNELKTNPLYITDDIDKEDFYEFTKCLDEFPAKLDPSNRIKLYDDILSSKLHTFPDIRPNFPLNNLYDTEKNNISLIHEYINIEDIENSDLIKKGQHYKTYISHNNKTNFTYLNKETNKTPLEFYRHEIINFSREFNILLQLNHPSIIKFYSIHEVNSMILYALFLNIIKKVL